MDKGAIVDQVAPGDLADDNVMRKNLGDLKQGDLI